MKYMNGNERHLRDDPRCRKLEKTFYCHPTATFDIVQTLFSVGNRIKDWPATQWRAWRIKKLFTVRQNNYWPPVNNVTYKIPILSLIFVASPKAQGLVTMALKCRWTYFTISKKRRISVYFISYFLLTVPGIYTVAVALYNIPSVVRSTEQSSWRPSFWLYCCSSPSPQ